MTKALWSVEFFNPSGEISTGAGIVVLETNKFFVYENWRARGHRMRIHKGSCKFCRNGLGISGGKFNPLNGKWHGEFSTLKEARARANSLLEGPQAETCGVCFKKVKGEAITNHCRGNQDGNLEFCIEDF